MESPGTFAGGRENELRRGCTEQTIHQECRVCEIPTEHLLGAILVLATPSVRRNAGKRKASGMNAGRFVAILAFKITSRRRWVATSPLAIELVGSELVYAYGQHRLRKSFP